MSPSSPEQAIFPKKARKGALMGNKAGTGVIQQEKA